MKKPMFSPSLMCMDFLDIRSQIETLNPLCDFFHVDIMDGHYVKNITLSPDFVRAVSTVSKKDLDCHLMVEHPEDYVETLASAGASCIMPQAETINSQAFRILNKIKSCGCKTGVVLNPATSLFEIEYYIQKLDKITVMTVDVGYAGQPFIEEMLSKIEFLSNLKKERGYKFILEVDGSCNEKTFKKLYKAGAECFVVGTSGLFSKNKNLTKAWDIMRSEFKNQTGV
ncbi:MAG: ribulose-phosphate 3-epimerase [Clostridia bacterium]|nr:ribulose-phosphate 3-epimerase [Clostridia bacterium]